MGEAVPQEQMTEVQVRPTRSWSSRHRVRFPWPTPDRRLVSTKSWASKSPMTRTDASSDSQRVRV